MPERYKQVEAGQADLEEKQTNQKKAKENELNK
jgi:hypothetical protein